MTTIGKFLLCGVFAAFVLMPAPEARGQAQAAKEQFVYVLRVTPKFHDPSSWKEGEQSAVTRHFDRLSKAARTGQVIHAGRTNEPLDKTFGLVIFEAANEAEARAFMEEDPAIQAGVMSGMLHRYSVALLRQP